MSTAEDHWEFLDLLIQHVDGELEYPDRDLKKFLFVSGFEHGYKHGFHDREEKIKEDKKKRKKERKQEKKQEEIQKMYVNLSSR